MWPDSRSAWRRPSTFWAIRRASLRGATAATVDRVGPGAGAAESPLWYPSTNRCSPGSWTVAALVEQAERVGQAEPAVEAAKAARGRPTRAIAAVPMRPTALKDGPAARDPPAVTAPPGRARS